MDKVAGPRDIIEETVLLTNESKFTKYVVYATVNEISVDTKGEIKEFVTPVMTDRTNTITSWIEVTRGRIEILPGDKKEIPVTFRINPLAKPGEYHAFIGFVPAKNRDIAEDIAMKGEADGVVVKITVADQRADSMKIAGFLVDRFITDDDKKKISIVVENLGDIPSAPSGEVIFYDSRGSEIGSVQVNSEAKVIEPGETVTLTSEVPIDDKLGRFKANVSLQYGKNMGASLHDTTFFYMMPIHLLVTIFGGILIVVILVTLLLRRTFSRDNYNDEDGEEVLMYVREGHTQNPKEHDIDLKNKTQ